MEVLEGILFCKACMIRVTQLQNDEATVRFGMRATEFHLLVSAIKKDACGQLEKVVAPVL